MVEGKALSAHMQVEIQRIAIKCVRDAQDASDSRH